MYIDGSLQFSNAQALTVTAASTSLVDLTGAGSGNAPAISFGTASVFGADMGIGDGMAVPKIFAAIGTTFVGGTSLNLQCQFAVDNGSNAPGTWQTYAETGVILTASLKAGVVIGTFDLPRGVGDITVYPLPRFIRLNYVIVGTFSAGTVTSAIVIQRDDRLGAIQYPSNFTVAA